MKIKKQLWKLRCGNKGVIFTTDVVLAMIITIIILTLANFYVSRVSVDIFPELQIRRTGSDLLLLLDNDGAFNPPNAGALDSRLADLLPSYYDINLIGSGGGNCDFSVGSTPPVDRLIVAGRRFFVIEDTDKYCLVTSKIWQK